MPYPKSPCKDCENRHILCHSECDSYKEFRVAVDDISSKKREAIERDVRSRSKAHGRARFFKQKI